MRRLFVSISRTIDKVNHHHTLDAIADDGSAWWRVIGQDLDTGWMPMECLPDSSPPD